MTIGDKMVLTLRSHIIGTLGNEFDNVFAYEVTTGGGTTSDLFSQFFGDILPLLTPVIDANTVFDQITTINLDDPTDFDIEGISVPGESSGDPLPGFLTWTFRYIRAIRGINDGRKAFGGINESNLTGGVPSGGTLTALSTIADGLAGVLTGTDGAYTPRIWRRAGKYAPYSGDPPVGTDYPDTFYAINGVEFSRVSTQNSRKR